MPELARTMAILALAALIAVFCIRVAVGIRGSAVDHYRSRMLLQAAIINVMLCSVWMLVLSGLMAWHLVSGQYEAWLQPVAGLSAGLLPLKALWHYIGTPGRLCRRYQLRPHSACKTVDDVHRLAELMGVPAPRVLRSRLVSVPFVFGRSSRRAALALPDDASGGTPRLSESLLLHELAHIRNRDVGFLTWASAFFQDGSWLLLLHPALLLLLALVGAAPGPLEARVAGLYLACLAQLGLLYLIVRRDRERLADRSVWLLFGRTDLARAASYHAISSDTGSSDRLTAGSLRLLLARLDRSLADKAYFARRPNAWRVAWQVVHFLCGTHPGSMERSDPAIQDSYWASSAEQSAGWIESLWAGLLIGTLGPVLALVGLECERWILQVDPDHTGQLTAQIMLFMGLPAGCGAALLFLLPAWASRLCLVPTWSFLIALGLRCFLTLLVALATSSALLVGGQATLEGRVFLVFTAGWCFLVVLTASAVSMSLAAFWHVGWYWHATAFRDLGWLLRLVGPGLLAAPALIGGAWFLYRDPALLAYGGGCFLAGLVTYSYLLGRSTLSSVDRYCFLRIGRWRHGIEGRGWAGKALVTLSGTFLAVFVLGTALPLLVARAIGGWHSPWPALLPLLLLLILACGSLVFLASTRPPVAPSQVLSRIGVLWRICRLCHILTATEERPPCSLLPPTRPTRSGAIMADEMCAIYHWSAVVADSPHATAPLVEAAAFALECEQEGGFGPWPGAKPRLASTYMALSVLNRAGQPPAGSAEVHGRWVESCQLSDGSFQSPGGHRPRDQDTYFAIKALGFLGRPLDPERRVRCAAWLQNSVFGVGIEHCVPEQVFHRLEALRCLGDYSHENRRVALRWAESTLRHLSLAHPAYASQALLHTLEVLCVCRDLSENPQRWAEMTSALGARVQAVLRHELGRLPRVAIAGLHAQGEGNG